NYGTSRGALEQWTGSTAGVTAFKNSGSTNFNYKSFHSVVLLAASTANYRFLMTDVGAPGRMSDGGVYDTSRIRSFIEDLEDNTLVCVADEAFRLTSSVMRPYPG